MLIELLGEGALPLGKELIRQAEELGAKPYFNIINYEMLRTFFEKATEEQIKMYAKHDVQRMRNMDSYIGIWRKNNVNRKIMA